MFQDHCFIEGKFLWIMLSIIICYKICQGCSFKCHGIWGLLFSAEVHQTGVWENSRILLILLSEILIQIHSLDRWWKYKMCCIWQLWKFYVEKTKAPFHPNKTNVYEYIMSKWSGIQWVHYVRTTRDLTSALCVSFTMPRIRTSDIVHFCAIKLIPFCAFMRILLWFLCSWRISRFHIASVTVLELNIIFVFLCGNLCFAGVWILNTLVWKFLLTLLTQSYLSAMSIFFFLCLFQWISADFEVSKKLY